MRAELEDETNLALLLLVCPRYNTESQFPFNLWPSLSKSHQAGGSELFLDLNNLSSRREEMISRDHRFGGSSEKNSEKRSSSLSTIHSNELVVTL